MPVTRASLLSPVGLLEPFLFPEDRRTSNPEAPEPGTLEHRLDGYITDALERVAALPVQPGSTDAAVLAWAYHRAYSAVYIRLASNPASANFQDQGGHTFAKDQRSAMADEAAHWLAEYRAAIVPAASAAQAPQPPPNETGTVPARFKW
jgi:hypothetical protein